MATLPVEDGVASISSADSDPLVCMVDDGYDAQSDTVSAYDGDDSNGQRGGNAGELQAVMNSLKSTGVLRQSVGNRTLHYKLHEGQRGRFWRELPARQHEINQRCVELVTNTSILRAVLPRFELPGEADDKLDKRQQSPPAEVLSRRDAKALASPLAETYRRCAYTRLHDPGHAGANARCSATLALALEPALHRFWSACLLTEVDRLRENHSQVDVLTSARGNLEPWPLSLIAGHLGLSV